MTDAVRVAEDLRSDALSSLRWRKSTSSHDTGDCVEVAVLGRAVLVRDSKAGSLQTLAFAPVAWELFVNQLKFGAPYRR